MKAMSVRVPSDWCRFVRPGAELRRQSLPIIQTHTILSRPVVDVPAYVVGRLWIPSSFGSLFVVCSVPSSVAGAAVIELW